MTDQSERLEFTWRELAGSLGDLGTFLPLVIGVAVACQLDLGLMLIMAGATNVATGLLFRQPVPVQPMKALAAVAITEQLSGDQLVAAGLVMGIVLIALALVGLVDRLSEIVPRPVVRGIQLGVGAKLVLQAIDWLSGIPLVAWDGLIVAALAGLAVGWGVWAHMPSLLFVFIAGLGIAAGSESAGTLAIGPPEFGVFWPSPDAWAGAIWYGALPQLPLTLLNSVVAVCALSADYFPGRGISPRRMATSVGLMNLLTVPLGGVPMCHGSGGLAAQYAFGARTGGSVVMLGIAKVAVGLLFGASMLSLLGAYPQSILAVMIALAGITLAQAAGDSLRGPALVIVLATALPIVLWSTTTGFLVGMVAAPLMRRVTS